jgi:hypothetical protein
MEETGWERRIDSAGRVAARLLEKDCVPVDLTLVLVIENVATED